jgi:epoxide hydrolase-like predicted phosphatase
MFSGFDADPGMVGVVRRARRAGIRTALCSNSWGNEYPRAGWAELFDAVVISGEVGMRKPERRIYDLTAQRLRLRPAECVFVDDLGPNVRGAVDAGMVGVRHESAEQTAAELEALFGVALLDGR